MVLGSIAVAAASRNPEAILIAPAAMQQMSINFTRSNEKEADRIGFNNLVKAGFNPDDMTMMFQRMQSKYQNEDSEQFSYLMTHPLPSERLSDMRIRADSLEKTAKNSYRDNIDFYFMQKRAEIWANKDLKKLIRNYKKDQKSDTKNISFSGREIPYNLGVRSLVILVLSLFIVLFIIFIVMIIEDQYNQAHLTFEIFSAFATNGMSTGTSSNLSEFSKIIFIFGMFIGRLGPMTLALLISGSKKQIEYRFFEEKVRIG